MNIRKLKGKMVEKDVNVESLAAKIGMNKSTLYRKLNEGDGFTTGEAQKIKVELNLTNDEARDIFFG
jgi:transposase-like protein